jgi:hypothetical protein
MLCEHLRELENKLKEAGFVETWRGKAWTENCREWVYFDVVLDIDRILHDFTLSPCLRRHENLDPKSGTERGLVCEACRDAIMGKTDGAVLFP